MFSARGRKKKSLKMVARFSPSPCPSPLRGEGAGCADLRLRVKGPGYEYFFVRRVGAVFAGSSGQTCFG